MKNVLSVILSISLALSFPIELIAEPNAGLMDTVNFFIESAALSIGDSSNVDSEFESKNDLRDSGLSYDSTAQTDSKNQEDGKKQKESQEDSDSAPSLIDSLDSKAPSVDGKDSAEESIGDITIDRVVFCVDFEDLSNLSASTFTSETISFNCEQNVTEIQIDNSDNTAQFQMSVVPSGEKYKLNAVAVQGEQTYCLPEQIKLSFIIEGQGGPIVKTVPIRWEIWDAVEFQYDSKIDIETLSENKRIEVNPVACKDNRVTLTLLNQDWYEITNFNSSLSMTETTGFQVGKHDFTVLAGYGDYTPYSATFEIEVLEQIIPSIKVQSDKLNAELYIDAGRYKNFMVNVFNKDEPAETLPNLPIEIGLAYHENHYDAGIYLYKNLIHVDEKSIQALANGTDEDKKKLTSMIPNGQTCVGVQLKLDYTGSSGQYYYALADTKENLENIKEWQYDTYDDFFTFLILKEDYSIDEKIVKNM